MQTGRGLRRHDCNKFVICRIPDWREIPSRRPGTRLFARTSNAPASGGDSTTASGMCRSRIFCACLSGSAQWLCHTAGRTDAPRHPEISVCFVPSCFPLMLHLAAKPLCFLRKSGKNVLKMTGFSRITFIGRICWEKNPPFVVFFFHSKQNHMECLQFKKECLILFPVSSCFSRNTNASRMLPICCFPSALGLSDPRAVKFAVLHV